MTLPRLQQRTTPDTVADVLREAILDGTLEAGSPMREVIIAGELGISRAPLREALRRLEQEGLVVKIPFKGAFVAEPSEQSINDIAGVRFVLEPWAIEQGLQCPEKSKWIAEMKAVVNRLSEAARMGKVQDSISAHLAFHRIVYEAAGNEVLTNLWRNWENQLRLFLAADLRQTDGPTVMYTSHAAIFAAIEKGDVQTVRDLLGSHIHGAAWRRQGSIGNPDEEIHAAAR